MAYTYYMSLFLILGVAVFALLVLGVFYGVITDPARIDEEEDSDVAAQTPAERHGYLRSYHSLGGQSKEDRIAEVSKADYSSGEVNDL